MISSFSLNIFVCHQPVLSNVSHGLQKQETKRMRETVSSREALCVALRYLVTGNAKIAIDANYRISPTFAGITISENYKSIGD